MKKTLMVLIVLLSLFIVPNFEVNALTDSFYVGEYLSGEYIVKLKNQTGKYEQMQVFRRKNDNRIAYCLELWEGINENKTLTGYDNEQYNYANIDYSDWERVMLISYYGYGYQNHTGQKWIAITQFMIWKTLSPDSTLYFTDTLNGKKVSKYEQEMEEINNLIRSHATLPSFNNQIFTTKYKEDYQVIDTNNVLDKYDITSYNTNKVSKTNNTLTTSTTTIGENTVILANFSKIYSNNPTVYVDPNGQDLLIPGNYNPIYSIVKFNLPEGNITVTKLDRDTNTKIPQGSASLSNSKFILMDKDNTLISTQTITNNNELTFDHLGYGTYYLKEVESGEGYLLNDEIIEIEVNNNYVYVNFYNQVIKEKIIIKKYIRNTMTNEIAVEEGALFSVYDSSNKKITTFKTNYDGKYELTLPYGLYTIKQDSGKSNYLLTDDFTVNVTSNNLTKTYELYNDKLTTNIKVINTDFDSKLPILESGATFKIKNIETNDYVKDENQENIILKTNSLGFTDFITLSSGSYKIEQLDSVDGYQINDGTFIIEINENSNFKYDNNNQRYFEIIVPNTKQKGKIEIKKLTEYYLNDKLLETKVESDIMIPIYAKDDIYAKDGLKIYSKDSEVTKFVTTTDLSYTKELIFGSYYIKDIFNDSIIDIIIDNEEIKNINLLEKVYNYVNELPNNDYNASNEKDIKNENNDCEKVKDNNNSDINDNNKSDNEIIDVPNTFTTNIGYFNIDILLIILGLILIIKGKKHES